MRNTASVRKRFTPAERARILQDYRTSGLTQREFVGRVGISLGCLSIWLRHARQSPPGGKSPAFLEIPPASLGSARTCYKFELPGGIRLEVPPGFSRAEVRELLRLAQAL